MNASCLRAHYQHQIRLLESLELQLLEVISGLKRCLPATGFSAAIAGVESCSHGRLDFLRAMMPGTAAHATTRPAFRGGCEPRVALAMSDIVMADPPRGRAMAVSLCAALDRQLINAYRVARQLAEGLRRHDAVRRFDGLMSAMADRNLSWNSPRTANELHRMALVSG